MVILIDTNVLLDVLQDRNPFLQESGEVIRLCGERSKGRSIVELRDSGRHIGEKLME